MMQAAINERFYLRALAEDDISTLFHLIERNRERLKDYFPLTLAQISSIETCSKYVSEKMVEIRSRKFFCFVIEDAGQALQGLFFLKNVDWRVPKCELAYFIDEQLAGQGIMTAAFNRLIGHCFGALGFNRLYLIAIKDNIPSRKLAERCGFQLEGVLQKDFRLTTGELVDDVLYGLVNPKICSLDER